MEKCSVIHSQYLNKCSNRQVMCEITTHTTTFVMTPLNGRWFKGRLHDNRVAIHFLTNFFSFSHRNNWIYIEMRPY